MIQDLHAHTYYSFCGADKPDDVVEAAIAGGVGLLGITDHNYGIGYAHIWLNQAHETVRVQDYNNNLRKYYDHIDLIREKYRDRIQILRGIELATAADQHFELPQGADVSYFDYCLVEHLDGANTVTEGNIFDFAQKAGCRVGIAHTDLFGYIEKHGWNAQDYFTRLAEHGIFWEMNVNYDSIHKYREHQYVIDFLTNVQQQDIVRKSGVRLSVGFDGHRAAEYDAGRVRSCCDRIEQLGIKLAFQTLMESDP